MANDVLNEFIEKIGECQILDASQLEELRSWGLTTPGRLAQELLKKGWLTSFQINHILQGTPEALTLGSFQLISRLGEGAMGEVYKAKQKNLDRLVALKVIRAECQENPRSLKRFSREIMLAGHLKHPNIVRAYDADQADGRFYIAMEFVEGWDLGRVVKHKGPLPIMAACDYIRQAALGLQSAHDNGIIHRDIKPANLLVTEQFDRPSRTSGIKKIKRDSKEMVRPSTDSFNLVRFESYPWGLVKILDMGLARWDDDPTHRHLTMKGSMIGTPDFVAPEQSQDARACDLRADLYSLGCTMYYLLTGRVPFPKGTFAQKLLQHQKDEPEPMEAIRRRRHAEDLARGSNILDEKELAIPPSVEFVVQKLMAKDPDDRFSSASGLAQALQVIEDDLPKGIVDSPSVMSLRSPPKSKRPTKADEILHLHRPRLLRSRGWVITLAAALLSMVGGAALLATR